MDYSYTFYFSQSHSQESPIPREYVSESSRLSPSNESPSIEGFSHHLQHSTNTSQERTSTEVSHLVPLENMVCSSFPQLKATINNSSCGAGVLNVTHNQMHYHPPAGYIYRVRLVVTCKSDEFNYDK